jgi:N-acetyl-gamma-glutamyl-phosphate reductase/acetylglutamate kinase
LQHLSKELFTDSGAGTLIRRGYRLHRHGLDDLDVDRFRVLLEESDKDVVSGESSVASYLLRLKQWHDASTAVKIYGDEAYEVAAVVAQGSKMTVPTMDKFVASKSAVMNNVVDNLWAMVRKEHPQLIWCVDKDDSLRPWFFNHADGSWALDDKTVSLLLFIGLA